MTLEAGAPARPTRRSVHQGHDWTDELRPAAPWGTGTWKRGSQVQVHSGGTGRAENSCRAPICRNERDRMCRGGGWWRLQESPRLSLAGGPAANQTQWFAWAGEGRRDHPSHHYNPVGPPAHTPPLHTRTHTSWLQGPSRDRVAGSREQAGWKGGSGQMDRDGRDRDACAEV